MFKFYVISECVAFVFLNIYLSENYYNSLLFLTIGGSY